MGTRPGNVGSGEAGELDALSRCDELPWCAPVSPCMCLSPCYLPPCYSFLSVVPGCSAKEDEPDESTELVTSATT